MSTLFTNFSQNINQISPLEHSFTEVLNAIALKPKILYFYGKLPENMSKIAKSNRPHCVAVVGSRRNTKYGEEVAYKLAYELAQKGIIVISGLAYGIDSIAHRGALDAGGITVAVLGNPIDKVHPVSHTGLAREIIAKGGAIISEYPPTTIKQAPLAPAEAGWDGVNWFTYEDTYSAQSLIKRRLDVKQSFLYRNRLIAGLSDAVVVVEAAERSGSLNTATHALNQGKYVFAVPGNITSPYSQGCNKLIKQGAFPYTELRDVIELLLPDEYIKNQKHLKKSHLIGDNDVETKILQSISHGHRSGEEIMIDTKLPPEVFNEAITMLEIKSRVLALGMNTWGLN